MAIKRYVATQDNTITNAYKANLTVRGVSGNMGQSDILETFHIYGQESSASSENCRILVQFPTTAMATDRTAGDLPTSGNVSFYLRMFNAEHSQTTPKDFTLAVQAVSRSWQEGLGLDMENYSDIDESNWLYASDTKTKASASLTVADFDNASQAITMSGSNSNYLFTAAATDATNEFDIGTSNAECAASIERTINTSASADFSASVDSAVVTIYAASAGPTANANALTSSLTDFVTVTGSQEGADTLFRGGSPYTLWTVQGGDYYDDASSSFSQTFDTGFGDMEVDITTLVEQWLDSAGNGLGSKSNYGVGIMLSGSEETAAVSYYTKMFFARQSQFFFKRPIVEARWDNSRADDRNNFYLSSSLLPASNNLMKLYLYNIVRGQLTDIPGPATGGINISIYSGSIKNTAPSGSKLFLPVGGDVVTTGDLNITGGWAETGIYTASFAYASSSITTIFDVWHSGGVEYHTGSAISVKTFNAQSWNLNQKYVSNITNLQSVYSNQENARIRLYVRKKNWGPNIYVKASEAIPNEIVDNAYYRISRISDGFKVVEYGTGSLNQTKLSYDNSGSYFDFDMGMLDTDEVYAVNFAYKINGNFVHQPEEFRFRVE